MSGWAFSKPGISWESTSPSRPIAQMRRVVLFPADAEEHAAFAASKSAAAARTPRWLVICCLAAKRPCCRANHGLGLYDAGSNGRAFIWKNRILDNGLRVQAVSPPQLPASGLQLPNRPQGMNPGLQVLIGRQSPNQPPVKPAFFKPFTM